MRFQPSALSIPNTALPVQSVWQRKPTLRPRKIGTVATAFEKEDVRVLQAALNAANRPSIPLVEDGDFAEKLLSGKEGATLTQVKLFQAMNDLTPNGVVDAAMWSVLAAKIGKTESQPTQLAASLPEAKKKFDWATAADAANFVTGYLVQPKLDARNAAQQQLALLRQTQPTTQPQLSEDEGKPNTMWWILGTVGGLVVLGSIGLTIWAVTKKTK